MPGAFRITFSMPQKHPPARIATSCLPLGFLAGDASTAAPLAQAARIRLAATAYFMAMLRALIVEVTAYHARAIAPPPGPTGLRSAVLDRADGDEPGAQREVRVLGRDPRRRERDPVDAHLVEQAAKRIGGPAERERDRVAHRADHEVRLR